MGKDLFNKITIVTVTFNAEDFLEKTIKSIINQDYKNIEFIIIDGGSKDNTVNIIKKYSHHINYWISELDNGIYDAMNKGIDVATGEWINFMNAGDSFYNNKILSNISKYFINHDVIYGGTQIIKENGENTYFKPLPMEVIWKYSYCNHQSMFVRTSILKKNKFNLNYRLAAEKELFIKLYIKNYKYFIYNHPISNFIITKESFSTKYKVIDSIEMLYILTKYIDDEEKILQHNHYNKLVSYNTNNNLELSIKINIIYDKCILLSNKYNTIAFYGFSKTFHMIKHLFIDNKIIIFDTNIFPENKNVYFPKTINEHKFDILIIMVLGREDEIIDTLTQKYNIPQEKIITFR